jgi:hypothetical protein
VCLHDVGTHTNIKMYKELIKIIKRSVKIMRKVFMVILDTVIFISGIILCVNGWNENHPVWFAIGFILVALTLAGIKIGIDEGK